MKNRDKYNNFEELAEAEEEGRDFRIRYADRRTGVLLIGPHAGAIEPHTSDIVLEIARGDLSYYLFEGIKPRDNGYLHITSTRFNEPQALRMAEGAESIITIHGVRENEKVVYLGGLNKCLLERIKYSLDKAGFVTGEHKDPTLQGVSRENICNRSTNFGVQLEIGRGLRDELSGSPENLRRFASAIRESLDGYATA